MRFLSIKSITEVPETEWAKIAPPEFPFASYAFLSALETCNCVGDRTGWFPMHQLAWDGDELVGAFLLFLKTNSYGEYIFDFAWANAFESSGLNYYPKLVSAIPFTPATGPKLFFAPRLEEGERADLARAFLKRSLELAREANASSVHTLFIPKAQADTFSSDSYTLRDSFQFHWQNNSYSSFDDFLGSLKAKRRKEILRERAQVAKTDVKITRLTGDQLTQEHAEIMYAFYASTVRKMGAYAYLTREFYSSVFKTMKNQILFVLAEDSSGEAVAGALNYFGSDTLFGRSWGCIDDYKALHFELCYYQGIEFAISKEFRLFEAGAQGEHKLQRGFLPALTYSAHAILDPQFKRAIDSFISAERHEIEQLFSLYADHSPFADRST